MKNQNELASVDNEIDHPKVPTQEEMIAAAGVVFAVDDMISRLKRLAAQRANLGLTFNGPSGRLDVDGMQKFFIDTVFSPVTTTDEVEFGNRDDPESIVTTLRSLVDRKGRTDGSADVRFTKREVASNRRRSDAVFGRTITEYIVRGNTGFVDVTTKKQWANHPATFIGPEEQYDEVQETLAFSECEEEVYAALNPAIDTCDRVISKYSVD